VRFLELDAEPALVTKRLGVRTAHYMPPSLLASQLSTLEPLQPDEPGVHLAASHSPESLVDEALTALGLERKKT
jgi:gluconokinase